MPHLTLEYSANLEARTDIGRLCRALHAAVMESGLFELGAVRVRAFAAAHDAVADLEARNSFLDMSLRIGEGRTPEDAKRAGSLIFAAAERHLADLLSEPHFALSLEVREIDAALSWKRNAIHPRLRAARACRRPTPDCRTAMPNGGEEERNTPMGKLALAAKITHVPSMYLSEQEGPHKGCRQAAIDGHYEIGRRCRALGVDTIVVFDTHWLVNAGYHINCAPRFEGIYTSNELPHFIKNLPYAYPGNPGLGKLLAETATAEGVHTRAHDATSLTLEYGTLVPMRYMNADRHFKVVSVSALCMVHDLADSARLGAAMRKAVEEKYDGTVAFFASGSLSHRFAQNGVSEEYLHKMWSPFLEATDHEVVGLWERGDWKTFCGMLLEYAHKCHGEGFMHDTAMLMGALGWDAYRGKVEVVTPFFPSSGTGQINAIFPV